MTRLTTRRALLVGIGVGILVGIGVAALAWIVADRNRQAAQPPATTQPTISPGATQPTIPPPPTVTALAATSSTVMATGKTTRDPETFTTGTVAGPIQVRVIGQAPCQGTAGQGWRVRYQVTSASRCSSSSHFHFEDLTATGARRPGPPGRGRGGGLGSLGPGRGPPWPGPSRGQEPRPGGPGRCG